MDDTQQSRTSDAAAAATRKRRSSILKSQRPPRAPFSELEFNIATPTDTTKSRRVSFSRRNGVAEFATNEATTTWKNFYEEHNKSLESSGNDSGAKPRPSVGHIGKRIFDEQFQEVDASHFIQDSNHRSSEISINNVNFVEEATDKNIEAPNKKYEMSMFTDHSNVFGNDMGMSVNGEMTDKISFNFSAPVKFDDLEEMEKDLENQFQAGNVVGPAGRAFGGKDVSEYIEFDLNTTHVADKDQSDMSITDTIHSPKVQAVAAKTDKNSVEQDWIADKENIAVNPYVTPKEEDNFAINEEDDKVLVFDGKRLTLQTEKYSEIDHNATTEAPKHKQRKNIVLNVDDDLPNFVDNPYASMSHKSIVFKDSSLNKSTLDKDNKTLNNIDMDISMTQCVPNKIDVNSFGGISMTEAVPNVRIDDNTNDRRKTVVYEDCDGNISITQAVPKNLLLTDNAKSIKKHTIVFESNGGNVSVTQIEDEDALNNDHKDIIDNKQEKRKTIVYTADDGDISVTQGIPNVIIPNENKRKTIVFDDNSCDISITQAIPTNILSKDGNEKRKTIIFAEDADISVTQAIPANIITGLNNTNKNNFNDISITQAITNFNEDKQTEKRKTILFDCSNADISMTQAIPNIVMHNTDINDAKNVTMSNENKITEKRKTILFDKSMADISMTQAIPNIVMHNTDIKDAGNITMSNENILTEKRKTILFDTSMADISMTQAIPNIVMHNTDIKDAGNITMLNENKLTEKRKTILFDTSMADISMTQAIPNIIMQDIINAKNISINNEENPVDKTKTILFDMTNADLSITETMNVQENNKNTNLTSKPEKQQATNLSPKLEKQQPILFDWNTVNIPMSKSPNSKTPGIKNTTINEKSLNQNKHNEDKRKSKNNDMSLTEIDMPDNVLTDVKQESIDTSKSDPKRKNSNVPNIPTWLRSKASEAKEASLIQIDIDNDFDLESIVQTKETQNESIIRIPKSVVNVEERNIKNKIQSILGDDSDSISTGSSDRTSSQRVSACESTTSLSEANVMSQAKPVDNSETTMKVASDVFYETVDIMETQSTANFDKEKNQVITKEMEDVNNKTVKDFDNDVPNKSARPIPSDMLNMLEVSNRSTIEDILKLKSEVSFEQVPNTNVFVYQSEANSPNKDCNNTENMEDDSYIDNENKIVATEKSTAVNESKDANTSMKLLTNLLDMSHASFEVKRLDKLVSADISSEEPAKSTAVNSNDDLFFVTPDDEVVTQTETGISQSREIKTTKESTTEPNDSMINLKVNLDLLKKLATDSKLNDDSKTLQWKAEDTKTVESAPIESDERVKKERSYKTADSTKDLLDMLSEFTDLEERDNPVEIKSSSHVHYDLTKRKSLPMTREDFMNNISMAKAILETTDVDNTVDTHSIIVETVDKSTTTKSSVKVSTDVVKTLKFDEVSFTELDDDDSQSSPLRKHAYSDENQTISKNNVIPNYWSDAVDDIKNLMNDLVKPNADSMPFDTLASKDDTTPSLNSMEVQANLFTSSQVDLVEDEELARVVPSRSMDVEEGSSKNSPLKNKIKFLEKAVTFFKEESPEDNSDRSNEIIRDKKQSPKSMTDRKTIEQSTFKPNVPVITFDHNNPLNNVMLIPIDKCEVHKYEPIKREELNKSPKTDDDNENQMNSDVQQFVVRYETKQFQFDSDLIINTLATVDSLDQYTDLVTDLKDSQVNTVISMKNNSDLLAVSSSLTLVDSVMSNMTDRGGNDSKFNKSPLTLIYRQDDKSIDSDICHIQRPHNSMKRPKENDSPSKPCNKIQKKTTQQIIKTIIGLHNSPQYNNDEPIGDIPTKDSYNLTPNKKTGTSITVQQVIADYNLRHLGKLGENLISSLKKDLGSPSETSSKDRCICQNKDLCTCDSRLNCMRGQGLPMDWQPELLNEMSSKNLVTDSCVNAVARINALPFMGSKDCEWESSSREKWVFRLLHGRLRLTVHLGYHADNTDMYVRADTPVEGIKLNTVKFDKQNAIALLTVRFASEAVRYVTSTASGLQTDGGLHVGDGCNDTTADIVPFLLRRSSGVSRVALRWGRAMRDARAQLAYRITSHTVCSVKVANIPLRSVWEVTMRIEMTVDDASDIPWPKACDVTVTAIVAECKITQEEINKVVANVRRDWGHAPRTLWKVFRYLKKKTRNDIMSLDKY